MGKCGAKDGLPVFFLCPVDEVDRVVRPLQRGLQLTAHKQEVAQIGAVEGSVSMVIKLDAKGNPVLERSLGFLKPAQRAQASAGQIQQNLVIESPNPPTAQSASDLRNLREQL